MNLNYIYYIGTRRVVRVTKITGSSSDIRYYSDIRHIKLHEPKKVLMVHNSINSKNDLYLKYLKYGALTIVLVGEKRVKSSLFLIN
jgi:hypothetical protein